MTPEQPVNAADPHDTLPAPTPGWDESRIVVLLIGLCLMLESGLIYYQAGDSQLLISGVIGSSGLLLLLFTWLVPFEAEPSAEPAEPPLARAAVPTAAPAPAVTPPTPGAPAADTPSPLPPATAGMPASGVPESLPVSPAPVIVPPTPAEEPQLSWFERLSLGLKKTRSGFVKKIKDLVLGKTKIDDDLLDEIEATLYEADIGPNTTRELLEMLHKHVADNDIKDPEMIFTMLKETLNSRLHKFSSEPRFNPNGMTVFLIIGVNGVGKTTTIAKLAYKYIKEGKKVVLAAGDTFRAAAIDQLGIWGDRAGAEVIKGKEGGDPGALVFDAIHAGKKRQADLVIIDTAGRMHVKANLMDELKKIRKIAEKETDGGPHEILLVIDSTTGQNAVQQAKLFNEALPISGLIMTKLDGTAKGGVIFSVQEHLSVPVKFVGVGEKMDDLLTFNPEAFLEALFAADDNKIKASDYTVL